jgi:bifunctional oligoribonuclease and PAP phosphatase NrnA
MQEAIKEIKAAKTVILFTHRDPDGDAIGTMIALYIALTGLGKKVQMFSSDPVPEMYKFLPHSKKVMLKLPKNSKFDLAVVVDCGGIERIDGKFNVRDIVKRIVNIDHHPDNTRFGDVNYIEGISSVSEIVYKLLCKMKVKITKEIAECLYTGIMTDTGNFRYDYTTADTFEVAQRLIRAGAELSKIAMNVYETKTLPSVRILGAAMYNLESSKSGHVAWTVLSQKTMDDVGAKSEDLTGLVDNIRSIKDVEVAILFREEEDGIKVNFRSKFKVNVSKIAGRLGGGGHVRASGALLQGTLENAKKKVLTEVFKVIK